MPNAGRNRSGPNAAQPFRYDAAPPPDESVKQPARATVLFRVSAKDYCTREFSSIASRSLGHPIRRSSVRGRNGKRIAQRRYRASTHRISAPATESSTAAAARRTSFPGLSSRMMRWMRSLVRPKPLNVRTIDSAVADAMWQPKRRRPWLGARRTRMRPTGVRRQICPRTCHPCARFGSAARARSPACEALGSRLPIAGSESNRDAALEPWGRFAGRPRGSAPFRERKRISFR
jgi:hypothetical protein